MSNIFIDRVSELENLDKYVKPIEIPTRSIVIMVGPAGIGKSSLAQELLKRRYGGGKYIGIYTSLSKTYASANMFLYDLVEQFKKQLSGRKKIVKSIILSIASILDISIQDKVSVQLIEDIIKKKLFAEEISIENIPYVFDKIVEKTVSEISGKGYGLIVIDEYQDILKTINKDHDEYIKMFIKRFMDLQEHFSRGRVKFLFISSDYSFYEKIISKSYPENITTFYLGEMSRESVVDLFNVLLNNIGVAGIDIDEYVDLVGGNPSIIYEIVDGLKRNGDLRKTVYKVYGKRVSHLLFLLNRLGDLVRPETNILFKRLLDYPLEITSIPLDPGVREIIDHLVRENILQYACLEHVGIYGWDNVGGDNCFIDCIAPSNRLYYLALCELFGRDHPCSRKLKKIKTI